MSTVGPGGQRRSVSGAMGSSMSGTSGSEVSCLSAGGQRVMGSGAMGSSMSGASGQVSPGHVSSGVMSYGTMGTMSRSGEGIRRRSAGYMMASGGTCVGLSVLRPGLPSTSARGCTSSTSLVMSTVGPGGQRRSVSGAMGSSMSGTSGSEVSCLSAGGQRRSVSGAMGSSMSGAS